jgi:periplasmic divalent cation tolerance protein
MATETGCVQISTTVPAQDVADTIASALVDRRLAACVQVLGPLVSTYRWQGAVERAEEWLLLIKTEGRLFDAVADAIRELHPYETPEIIATEAVAGSPDYLAWISESVRPEDYFVATK